MRPVSSVNSSLCANEVGRKAATLGVDDVWSIPMAITIAVDNCAAGEADGSGANIERRRATRGDLSDQHRGAASDLCASGECCFCLNLFETFIV